MASYRAVMLTRQGGPEVMETVELPLRDPAPGEARVRVRACGAGATDILMRRGYYPYAPKLPFVQGYDVVGEVEAIGSGVTQVAIGDRVAALAVWGGSGAPAAARRARGERADGGRRHRRQDRAPARRHAVTVFTRRGGGGSGTPRSSAPRP